MVRSSSPLVSRVVLHINLPCWLEANKGTVIKIAREGNYQLNFPWTGSLGFNVLIVTKHCPKLALKSVHVQIAAATTIAKKVEMD